MFTYDVVSESVRNPHQLAAELTQRSREGWEVVQITYDGDSWFHAFIRHAGNVEVAPFPGQRAATTSAGSAVAGPLADQPAAASTPPSAAPVSASSPDAGREIPAKWYPDPSKRYELRYWNGTAWTEHVATGGKQSTDPVK